MKKFLTIKNNTFIKILLMILGVFFIFVLYEIIRVLANNPILFPTLKEIFNSFINLFQNSELFLNFLITIGRTFLAIFISFIFGYLLGNIAGFFPKFHYFFHPLISIMKCIPVPCFIFVLFVYFFNRSLISILIIIFIVIFPLIYEASREGITNIDNNVILSLRIEGLYKKNSLFKVILPLSFNYVLLSLLSSIGLALKIEITAEILLNPQYTKGIGQFVYLAYSQAIYPDLYATLILIVLVFLIFDIVITILKKFLRK